MAGLRRARALAALTAALAAASAAAACSTPLDCGLNGECVAAACVCDAPWAGPSCTTLPFKTTPASGKNLYNTSDPRNTWNGPIVTAADGTYHAFVPLYETGSLGRVLTTLHGVATTVTGPYDWAAQPSLNITSINPAFLVFPDAASGALVYSLWLGGEVHLAPSPYGPFSAVPGFSYPGVNPAPIFHGGAFYMTNQFTTTVYTTPAIAPGGVWTVHANISHAQPNYPTYDYHVEDPFMWVDRRGNWHIVNHAYSNIQFETCSASDVSAHFFSPDGVTWSYSQQPYGHTVEYDDGTSHSYVTLERPNLHFDAAGALTHISLAADLVTQDEGCASRPGHAHNGKCPCDNCKWLDHAGTTIVALQ